MKIRKFKFNIGDKVTWSTPEESDPTEYTVEARRFVYEEDDEIGRCLYEEYYLRGYHNPSTVYFWSLAKYLNKVEE